ncbi:hypothetical protein [Bradyrhizobium genosp. P]|uniref:hypothetical protein n=1 Tax=Bradyrhizobium genosp. P TaxID=83641 RepID=UPI003CEAA571
MDVAIYERIPRSEDVKTDRETVIHSDGSLSVTDCTYRDRIYFAEIISRRHEELDPSRRLS